MPYTLPLPEPWKSRGWKVKIAEKERLEPPHATLYFRMDTWRIELRGGGFLDPEPDPADVPRDLVALVQRELPVLRAAWDGMYPRNPVWSRPKEALT